MLLALLLLLFAVLCLLALPLLWFLLLLQRLVSDLLLLVLLSVLLLALLLALLAGADWSFLERSSAEEATLQFNSTVLTSTEVHVAKRTLTEQKKSHPWINREACNLVRQKREAEGTAKEAEATARCSAGLAQAHREHAHSGERHA